MVTEITEQYTSYSGPKEMISFTAPSCAMRSSRSNLFTNFRGDRNWQGGATFGSQNQSGGPILEEGPKFSIQIPSYKL